MSQWRTIHRLTKTLTLTKEARDGAIHLAVLENERQIVRAKGKTEKEAAQWLVKHVNRIARQTEDMLLEENFLSAEEIDKAIQEDEERVASPTET
jgi:hypothetical protein